MNNGKEVCRHLREVRREIAEANDIRLIQPECTHEGDCEGTCPRCEQEVSWLEDQLEKRRSLGHAVRITGIAASIAGVMALSACTTNGGEPVLQGDPAVEMPDTTEIPLTGDLVNH